VEPALETSDGDTLEVPEQQSTGVPGCRCGRPAGELGERDGDGIDDESGDVAKAGAEDETHPRHEVRACPDDSLQLIQAGTE
jgi:hypothetical protein